MGLTTKELQNKIVPQECPHYYEIRFKNHPNGLEKVHCGTMKDVECVLSIYPDAVYSKVLLPPVPDTINVPHITVKDQELPMQQILPQSDLEPLDL